MEKIISYPLSILYYLCFGFFLILFHPIQWICFNFFGYKAHKNSVDILNFFLVKCTHLLGTTYTIENLNSIPKGIPLIIVANHQSLHDIPAIIWYMRKFSPNFISKKELGKGIPSVSYNLRHGGGILIDRKNPKQAIPEIIKLSNYIEKNKRSAVIFPEGTRSKTGTPKKFSETGLKILCKHAPSAHIVPITINNSWKISKWGMFPLGLGNKLHFTIHESFAVKKFTFEEIVQKTEHTIVKGVKVH